MKLRVTIQDADGCVVTDEEIEADEASQSEIDDMVRMIEAGTPAYIAAYLAKLQIE